MVLQMKQSGTRMAYKTYLSINLNKTETVSLRKEAMRAGSVSSLSIEINTIIRKFKS